MKSSLFRFRSIILRDSAVNNDLAGIQLDQDAGANYISACGNQLSFPLYATLGPKTDGFELL